MMKPLNTLRAGMSACVLVAIVATSGCVTNDEFKRTIGGITTRLTAMDKRASALAAGIKANGTAIDGVAKDVERMDKDLKKVLAALAALENVQTRVKIVEGTISEQNKALAEFVKRANTLDDQARKMDDGLSKNTRRVEAVVGELEEMKRKIPKKLDSLVATINALRASLLKDVEVELRSLHGRTAALQRVKQILTTGSAAPSAPPAPMPKATSSQTE